MPKEDRAPQSKWSKNAELQSKTEYSENYKVSNNAAAAGATLEQRITRAQSVSLSIPLGVLAHELSPATAIAHYLRATHSLTYAEIARTLNRDSRTIWTLLSRANKTKTTISATPSAHQIPLALFQNRNRSILEHTVTHLREQGLTIKAIAELLKKHPSTISTVHQRAKRKQQ